MKKNPKREASRKVSSQRKKKTKAESLVPEIVVTKHSDYPLFPLKAAFLGRYLLIFFGALGINLVKLESRPIPDRDFEFMFYFDLETSIYSDEYAQLMCELDSLCEDFRYLGSYSEIV